MGTVFSAGSIAGIAGVPSGLWLANHSGWRAPFWLIAGCAILTTSRFAPGMASITQAVDPRFRGGFKSVNSAVQQLASGAAALLAGAIVFRGPGGRLERYPVVGALCCLFVVLSIFLARRLKKPQA